MNWQWAAGPWRVGPQIDLSGMLSRSMTWSLTQATSASLSFAGNDDDLPNITQLTSDLWLWADGKVLHRGRLGAGNITGQTDKVAAVTLAAPSYKERWRSREVWGTVHLTSVDPADVLWDLFVLAQAEAGGDDGIVRGAHTAGATVPTVDLNDGSKISDAGDTLAGLGGFQWDITPADETTLQLDVWRPSRGADKGVAIEFGGAAVGYTWQASTGSFANAVRVSGQAPSGGGSAPTPQTAVLATATTPEGRWEKSESGSQTTTGTLAARAATLLAESVQVPVAWTVKLDRGWWQGPDHLWLGDTVKWQIRDGWIDEEIALPVQEIQADWPSGVIDPAIDPDITLTLGAPKKTRASTARDIERRLALLERGQ